MQAADAGASPSGFEGFIRETSEPTRSLETIQIDIDFDLIMAAAERFGAEVLGE